MQSKDKTRYHISFPVVNSIEIMYVSLYDLFIKKSF